MYTKVNARCISMIGVLVALEIVLSRFTIHTWNLKIGFSFVPVVVAAIFYGPLAAGLVGAIGDILSAVLFPVGAFFPVHIFGISYRDCLWCSVEKETESAKYFAGSCHSSAFYQPGDEYIFYFHTLWKSVLGIICHKNVSNPCDERDSGHKYCAD